MTREEAKREIDSLDYYLQNHTDDYGEESHTAMMMAIKALEQEPCEDAISRQAALEKIHWLGLDNDTAIKCDLAIRALPSVNPQSKTGHWEWEQYYYYPERGNWHCSECKCVVVECVDKNEKGGIPLYKYCPQCGAKIESEEQTSSDSEPPNTWQKHTDASGNSWHTCPTCGHIAYTLTRFCPDCGARLEAPA